jgi:hypothetical protein
MKAFFAFIRYVPIIGYLLRPIGIKALHPAGAPDLPDARSVTDDILINIPAQSLQLDFAQYTTGQANMSTTRQKNYEL